jgi:hypothetical protein
MQASFCREQRQGVEFHYRVECLDKTNRNAKRLPVGLVYGVRFHRIAKDGVGWQPRNTFKTPPFHQEDSFDPLISPTAFRDLVSGRRRGLAAAACRAALQAASWP